MLLAPRTDSAPHSWLDAPPRTLYGSDRDRRRELVRKGEQTMQATPTTTATTIYESAPIDGGAGG